MSQILWGSTLTKNKLGVLVPSILAVRSANGNFPCSWAITSAIKKNLYAFGMAEVTPAQQAAVQNTQGIPVVPQANFNDRFDSLSPAQQKVYTNWFNQIGVPPPQPSETFWQIWDRVSLLISNKSITTIQAELVASQKSASIAPPVIPAMVAFPKFQPSRRTLLKMAGIGAGLWMLRPRPVHSGIVFSDSFTVSVNTPLESYPSSGAPNYDWMPNGNQSLYVNAATDRVQANADSSSAFYVMLNAALPTGNQKITVTMLATVDSSLGLMVRLTSSTGDFYHLIFDKFNDLVNIDRYDAYSGVSLASVSRVISFPATCSFQAVGSGASIALTVSATGVSDVTYSDSDANRKASGVQGLWSFGLTDDGYIDDLTVDNLAGGGGGVAYRRSPVIVQ